jgi:hypothetical protein
LVLTALLFWQEQLTLPVRATGVTLVFLTLISWGGFFERRVWALNFEMARIAVISVLLLAAGTTLHSLALFILAAVFAFTMGHWVLSLRHKSL